MKWVFNLLFLMVFAEVATICTFIHLYGFNPGFYFGMIYNIIMSSNINFRK